MNAHQDARAPMKYIKESISESIDVKQRVLNDSHLLLQIEKAAQACVQAFRRGNKVLLAGNGGSAADSQHIATEFVSRFMFDRPALPAIAMTTDTSALTAIGNDYGYEKLFARQLEALAREGDVFIGLTTSGNSKNVLSAISKARDLKILTIGLSGAGGTIQGMCDITLAVPSMSTPRIQEAHITIGHIICGIVENEMFAK